MAVKGSIIVFGPAYLDRVLEIDTPLAPADMPVRLDQSLPALRVRPGAAGIIEVVGPTGDRLTFHLPAAEQPGAVYALAEPVLARLLGASAPALVGDFAVTQERRQLGGMGAGYARALSGLLRAPFGGGSEPDAVGGAVLAALAREHVRVAPLLLPACASDGSLVLLSARGEKLAIGVRQAMTRWTTTAEDIACAASADALVFCGAPNAVLAAVSAAVPSKTVMCAPALRNVTDAACPLAALASRIDYLTLNALEWAQLDDQEALRRLVPVITVTDGARGSRLLAGGEERFIPAIPAHGTVNANRAGETYGATVFSMLLPVLRRGAPCDPARAADAAQQATVQAHRQLSLAEFAFPME